MDIKTTFLNGFLKEEVYMHQPQYYIHERCDCFGQYVWMDAFTSGCKKCIMSTKVITIRDVIALANMYGWMLFQVDMKNAFLKGQLKDKVNMY